MDEFLPVTGTLTDSSDDSSGDDQCSKRSRMDFSHQGFGSTVGFSGRGSKEYNLQDDGALQLSDEEPIASKMMKEMKPKAFMDNKAQKMMEKMGYRAGKGLGKHSQGIVDPVEVSRQRGRRGLGLHLPGLEAADIEWNSEFEVIKIEEEVFWLEEKGYYIPITDNELNFWYREGPRKLTLEDETLFCDPKILKRILSSKTVFDSLNPEELRRARTRSNPFETIRGAFFLNRAAMKMANMDRVFDFMFTNPKSEDKRSLIGPNELLYFADVCAGPGGFSEYVLWRKKWEAKGFGFTLKGDNDFRLSDFYAGPSETFETYYGKNQDGNVCDPDNIESLKNFVLAQTDGVGVHFMMADGGFSVEGQENIQELLSKQLYLCQCLVALCIVREGGHFVCKLFDLFTSFSVGLIYLMYKSFKRISIHKPNTSRPANSERYIICKWKRGDCDSIADHLFRVNQALFDFGSTSGNDVTSLVDLSILQGDTDFFNYIVESNNSIGERQVVNLVKIAAFCRDTSLTEPKQAEMRRKSLEYWDIPDQARTAPPNTPPDTKCDEILKIARTSMASLQGKLKILQGNRLKETFKSVYDWHCVVLGSFQDRKSCTFYLGLGRNRVFSWDGNRWQRLDGNLELAPDTLIYAEIATERLLRNHKRVRTLQIIDAFLLGGIPVYKRHLTERHSCCVKFAKAHFKSSRMDFHSHIQLRVKTLYDLEKIENVFQSMESMEIRGAGKILRTVFRLDEDKFMLPAGLLFINATQEPWMRHLSQRTGKHFYGGDGKESVFDNDRTPDACADFIHSFASRHVWWWDNGETDHSSEEDTATVSKENLVSFVQESTKLRGANQMKR